MTLHMNGPTSASRRVCLMYVVQVRRKGGWTYVNEQARDTVVVLPGLILEEAVGRIVHATLHQVVCAILDTAV